MALLAGFRERLVLGHVRRDLEFDEAILAWSHANVPDTRAPALFIVTDRRCLLHVANAMVPDVATPLARLRTFDLDQSNAASAQVRLHGDDAEVIADFSLSSRARSRAMGRVLGELDRANVSSPAGYDPDLTSPLQPMTRGVRDHARRMWITVLGVAVLALSVVLSWPGMPGPGALTAVAGFAIRAKEYEWARDVHVWSARMADRLIAWARARKNALFDRSS